MNNNIKNTVLKTLNNIIKIIQKIKANNEIYDIISEEIINFSVKIPKNNKKYIFDSVCNAEKYDLLNNLKIYDKIGEGDTRNVYKCNYDDIVVKKDKYSFVKSCFLEFLFWIIIKNTPCQQYFSPCIAISKNFDELIMVKIDKSDEKYLNTEAHNQIKKLCDLIGYTEINNIERNFGVLDGKLVLCDYSMNLKYNEDFFNKIFNNN